MVGNENFEQLKLKAVAEIASKIAAAKMETQWPNYAELDIQGDAMNIAVTALKLFEAVEKAVREEGNGSMV